MRFRINKQLIFFCCCLWVNIAFAQINATAQTESDKKAVDVTLKGAFQDKFFVGTALNTWQLTGKEPEAVEVVKQHFNSVVAENVMKSARIQPREGEFNFALADKFVEFGEQNDMHIHGHTLIWHSEAPDCLIINQNIIIQNSHLRWEEIEIT